MNTIIGRKIEQKQVFLTDGTRIPVTVVNVVGNTVLDIKTSGKNGYSAVQIGFGARKKAGKALLGLAKKANLKAAPQFIREVRLKTEDNLPTIGEKVSVESVFKPGDIVKVTGKSKGKGFAGVVKRHNFRGGPRTHGQSDRERAPGAIGQGTTPGRVYKGKRMAGRMGHVKKSVTNLLVIDVVTENGKMILILKGLVPGPLNNIISIEKTGELPEKKFVPLLKPEAEKTENEVVSVESKEQVEVEKAEEKEVESVANTENNEQIEVVNEESKEVK